MKHIITLTIFSLVYFSLVSAGLGQAVADKQKYAFKNSRQPGQIDRVKLKLKAGGEVLNVVNGNEQREKLSVDCELDYEEKTLACPTNAEDASRSIRYYLQAGAVEKIGDADFKPVLRPNRSLIAAEVSSQESLLFSPSGPLTRIELDLIDMQGDSLLMDRFLPDKPLAVDDFWKPSEKLMAQFLGLDEVGHSEVQSVLKEVTDKVARFEMAGRVSGAVDGVATAIEIKA